MATQSNVRLKAIIYLGLAAAAAVTLGVLIVTMYQGYSQRLAVSQMEDEEEFFLVAAAELHPGLEITQDNVYRVRIAPKYLHNEAGEGSGLFRNSDQVIGRMPRERILENEFIRKERLADEDMGLGLNAIIPRGMRAIAVQLQGGRAVSGFLRPWDYVDVILTFMPLGETQSRTRTLNQAITVLGVGSEAKRILEEQGKSERALTRMEKRRLQQAANTVTLAVTPEQAEIIAYAQAVGTLTLTLRNNADLEPVEEIQEISVVDLFPDMVRGRPRR
jgi:pilus assembly protein CpaB